MKYRCYTISSIYLFIYLFIFYLAERLVQYGVDYHHDIDNLVLLYGNVGVQVAPWCCGGLMDWGLGSILAHGSFLVRGAAPLR